MPKNLKEQPAVCAEYCVIRDGGKTKRTFADVLEETFHTNRFRVVTSAATVEWTLDTWRDLGMDKVAAGMSPADLLRGRWPVDVTKVRPDVGVTQMDKNFKKKKSLW
jgi:hypothetical protein